uniref:Uncharacterized protein n=1 Tax=Cacopsylla melanoneura TaxID=428564 RepID=A0A8D8S811_9HEMI
MLQGCGTISIFSFIPHSHQNYPLCSFQCSMFSFISHSHQNLFQSSMFLFIPHSHQNYSLCSFQSSMFSFIPHSHPIKTVLSVHFLFEQPAHFVLWTLMFCFLLVVFVTPIRFLSCSS